LGGDLEEEESCGEGLKLPTDYLVVMIRLVIEMCIVNAVLKRP
jgi:hypothetical protein